MYRAADRADDAYGLVFRFGIVSRESAGILCAFDVIDSVALAVRVLVGQMVWKHLLKKDAFSVVAFHRHSDVNALFYFFVERAFFVEPYVELDVRNLARKAFVCEIGEKSQRIKDDE